MCFVRGGGCGGARAGGTVGHASMVRRRAGAVPERGVLREPVCVLRVVFFVCVIYVRVFLCVCVLCMFFWGVSCACVFWVCFLCVFCVCVFLVRVFFVIVVILVIVIVIGIAGCSVCW